MLSPSHFLSRLRPGPALLVVAILFLLLALTPRSAARADTGPEAPRQAQQGAQPRPPAPALDAQAMLSAVVKVKMRAVPGARSNATLGRERDGSGVIIDDQGHVLTIGYIVNEADSIEITTDDGKTLPAVLVAYDHASGVGLLHSVAPLAGKPLPLGESAGLAIREPVMILPAGGRDSASVAYVMSKRAFAGGWEYLLDSAIFTAPPTMQWSGAALVNREGKLVGIGSLLVRDAVEPGSPLPGNMFVPIDLLKPRLEDLLSTGRSREPARPWLGVYSEEIQGHVVVTRVLAESPAAKAGLTRGDIILGVEGEAVGHQSEFYQRLWATGEAGAPVVLHVLHKRTVRQLTIRSMDRMEFLRPWPI